MAASIARLIESPALAAQFGRAGRRRYEQHFTIDRMVQQTVRLYQRLLAPRTAPAAITAPIATQRGARR